MPSHCPAPRVRRLLLLTAALVCAGVTTAVAAVPVAAQAGCAPAASAPLPGSGFQGADGDQCDEPSLLSAQDTIDWQGLVAEGAFADPDGEGSALVDDDVPGGQNEFGTGSKEEKPGDWDFVTSLPNKKVDVLASWGYPDTRSGDLFLHLAFARAESSGTVNLNFELNQNDPGQTFTTSAGEKAIKRRAGDILVTYDRTGTGQNPGQVDIRLCRWAPTDPAQPWLAGTWADCEDLDAANLARGQINADFPVTNFLPGAGPALLAGQFGEASINLTDALDIGGPGQAPCVDFGAFWLRTRESNSITSNPVDFLPPTAVGVNNCGRVVIEKQTSPEDTADPRTSFGFTADFDAAVAEGDPGAPGAFSLADDEQQTVVKVQPGTYTVGEADPRALGYELAGVSCDDTNSGPHPSAARSARLVVDPGETVHCTFTNERIDSEVSLDKTGPAFAYHGDTLSYAFRVTNPGESPLHDVVVSDDRCPAISAADKNGDATPATLDPGEEWTYTCSTPLPGHIGGPAEAHVNTATVTAQDELDRPRTDSDSHSTPIRHPAIALAKTGPAVAIAGQPVDYGLAVTNPGDVAFARDDVDVTDPLCSGAPTLVTTGGDATTATLDPGDIWAYTCRVETQVGQGRVDNVATVMARDQVGGREVSDTDPFTTRLEQPATPPPSPPPPPPPPAPAPAPAPPRAPAAAASPPPRPEVLGVPAPRPVARATMHGPRSCASRSFRVGVTGRQIAQVVFHLDGRRYRTVGARAGRRVFTAQIDPRRLDHRVHRVTARVRFTRASGAESRSMRLTFQRCRPVRPRFTG